jgi:glutamyl-tRNA synthetase
VTYRGRFAPSPTGRLHLGSAATAIFAAAAARKAGGSLVLRIEDLDPPRVIPGREEDFARDLSWLGVRFDEGPERGGATAPYRQSERLALYEAALDVLVRAGHAYLCDCSRAEIARVASAPHEGDEGPVYPGTCRSHGMRQRSFRRPPAHRVAVPDGVVTYLDRSIGRVSVDVRATYGDFVLRRGDGVFAYQLAVIVDDLTMGITDVVRGADLETSAPRQAMLARLLDAEPPTYLHVPLLVGEDGDRLAKRTGAITIAEQRERGIEARQLVFGIARAYGQRVRDSSSGDDDAVDEVASALDFTAFPRQSVRLTALQGAA